MRYFVTLATVCAASFLLVLTDATAAANTAGTCLAPFGRPNRRSEASSTRTDRWNHRSWRRLRGGGRSAKSANSVRGAGGTLIETEPTSVDSCQSTSATIEPPLLSYNASTVDAGSLPMQDLWTQLEGNAEGLNSTEAARRLKQYGPNALAQPPKTSLWTLIAEQFHDALVQILVGVAVVSALFGAAELRSAAAEGGSLWQPLIEPLVIVAILVLNAAAGVWQTSSAASSLAALERLQAAVGTVRRDGQWVNLPAADIVPGDIVEVRPGDKVPADGRLVATPSPILSLDEGSLTGESETVAKRPGDEGRSTLPDAPLSQQPGLLYGGTVVTRGTGTVLVTHTGTTTQFGRIQQGVARAKAQSTKTPLTLQLDAFGSQLTYLIAAVCTAVWLVSVPKMSDPSFASVWHGALYYAKVSVALGVAAIPEGLPAVIALCLSLGTRRMAERNVIVRNLPSVETLGCTSVICTDKTGTLTTNEMTVTSLLLLEHDDESRRKHDAVVVEHAVEGYSYAPVGKVDGVECHEEVKERPAGAVADVAAVSALCNDAQIVGHNPDEHSSSGPKEKSFERVGEPTEAALCILSEKLGGMSHYLDAEGGRLDSTGLHFDVPPSILANANVSPWREQNPRLATLEFSRDRKSMSVLCDFSYKGHKAAPIKRHGSTGNRLLVKGAPNLLIERCSHVKLRDGTVMRMSGKLRRQIEKHVSELAARPLRCLALAVKESRDLEHSLRRFSTPKKVDENDGSSAASKHPLLSDPSSYRNIESGLTLVGIVGIKDPARPGVGESIDTCTKAGIRIMMITGDSKDTAIAIARDVHIFPPEPSSTENVKAFEGREFFLKTEQEQLEILKEGNIVFCRAEPADKQQLIKMLQGLDEIPAMTGDGVNDAPALQQAAIGIAMGITGTEVSKEAADMILADDNFSTIVAAVEEGRRIYANMQAFICFLISCNIGEICAIFLATVAGFPEPLTAMHLLWVNLVTDGPPATALGFNPPSPDLMEAPPRPSNEPIMTKWLLTRYCVTGLYVGLATIGVFCQYYLNQGVTLSQLSRWSQCGQSWSPSKSQCGEAWSPSKGIVGSCTELFQGSGRMIPQTLALTTLVCMEMFKALSAVSVDSSMFTVGPHNNRLLLLGVSGPFLLHLLVLYSARFGMPGLGESFGMVPLSKDQWMSVLSWSAPILLVDEILKGIGRWLYRFRANRQETAK